MAVEIKSYRGWERSVALFNDKIELIITLDVGPRVISARTTAGVNVFKNYDDQMGGSGEDEWLIRGGHRLWVAPEDNRLTYEPDNIGVEHEVLSDYSVRFISAHRPPVNIRRELRITLAPAAPRVHLEHTITNHRDEPITAASWGLSVMDAGGLLIIPQPALGEHPRDLLPNRSLVLWSYTDLADPRWRIGRHFITLQQAATAKPTKIGLRHTEGWVAYLNGASLFFKTIGFRKNETYPDLGVNFEAFTNDAMLEVESLSPLRTLAPGESVSHTEEWVLKDVDEPPASIEQEEALCEWLAPYLSNL